MRGAGFEPLEDPLRSSSRVRILSTNLSLAELLVTKCVGPDSNRSKTVGLVSLGRCDLRGSNRSIHYSFSLSFEQNMRGTGFEPLEDPLRSSSRVRICSVR